MKNSGSLKIEPVGERKIVITRVFDAPRHLVFRAMTEPELVRQWQLGPPGWTMPVCEIDLRVGGKYQYLWRSVDGMEMKMSGLYREIVPNERIVNTGTFEFGCAPQAGEQVGTTVLVEENGKTTLTSTIVYPSKEARDGTIASGMAKGVAASYDRLEELIPSTYAAAPTRATPTA